MGFDAKVWELFLAAPTDSNTELDFAFKAVSQWNAANAKPKQLILLPRHWNKDKAPNFAENPQKGIDKQLVQQADILVAILRNKLGPGTRHEIEEYRKTARPMLVYFCTGDVPRDAAESSLELAGFKKNCEDLRFYRNYTKAEDLLNQLSHDLALLINETPTGSQARPIHDQPVRELSTEAEAILLEASNDSGNNISYFKYQAGGVIKTNNKELNNGKDNRECARFLRALRKLEEDRLVESVGSQGDAFKLTVEGYEAADKIKAKRSLKP